MKKVVLLCVALVLSGCVFWKEVKTAEAFGPKKAFRVELPVGWMEFVANNPNDLLLTRDGFSLQRVAINHNTFKKAFEKTEVEVSQDTLLTDFIDYYVAEFLKRNEELSLEVDAKLPAVVGGLDGFKVTMHATNKKGLTYNIVAYGCLDEEGVYDLVFWAPEIHYFERDLPEFEKVVESFTVL